jgi:hypothetical protein
MASNPFRATAPTATNSHGKAWEELTAKKMGARLRPASGAMVGAKGDFAASKGLPFLYEAKSTTASSLPIKLEWLVKITEEAQAQAKLPALTFGFVLPTGRPRPNCSAEWVAIPLPVFQELLEALNAKQS